MEVLAFNFKGCRSSRRKSKDVAAADGGLRCGHGSAWSLRVFYFPLPRLQGRSRVVFLWFIFLLRWGGVPSLPCTVRLQNRAWEGKGGNRKTNKTPHKTIKGPLAGSPFQQAAATKFAVKSRFRFPRPLPRRAFGWSPDSNKDLFFSSFLSFPLLSLSLSLSLPFLFGITPRSPLRHTPAEGRENERLSAPRIPCELCFPCTRL